MARSSGNMAFIKPRRQVKLNVKKALKFPGKIRQDKEAYEAMKRKANTVEFQEMVENMQLLINQAIFDTSTKQSVDQTTKKSNFGAKKFKPKSYKNKVGQPTKKKK